MPGPLSHCHGSLRGYQVNEQVCSAQKVPIDCSKSPTYGASPPPATTGCRRNIFLDMGANWCNTMQLYQSVPEAAPAAGLAHANLPWHVFAIEAAPLIAPYVELCTEALAAGRPLPPPLVPPAGSSMQLLNYASELGCTKAGGRRERLACISNALASPLAALARTANPKLTANPSLLEARLDGARARGGCTPAPRGGGLLSAFSRGPDPSYRADGLRTAGGGTFTLLPAAAGASAGTLRMAGSPLQMLRGGSMAAGSNHMPQFDVPRVDVVSWIERSFTVDDFVILKMDVEGAEIGTRSTSTPARPVRICLCVPCLRRAAPRALCARTCAHVLVAHPTRAFAACPQTLCPGYWRRMRHGWSTSSCGSAMPNGAASRASANARSGRSSCASQASAMSTAKSIPSHRTRRAGPPFGMRPPPPRPAWCE